MWIYKFLLKVFKFIYFFYYVKRKKFVWCTMDIFLNINNSLIWNSSSAATYYRSNKNYLHPNLIFLRWETNIFPNSCGSIYLWKFFHQLVMYLFPGLAELLTTDEQSEVLSSSSSSISASSSGSVVVCETSDSSSESVCSGVRLEFSFSLASFFFPFLVTKNRKI